MGERGGEKLKPTMVTYKVPVTEVKQATLLDHSRFTQDVVGDDLNTVLPISGYLSTKHIKCPGVHHRQKDDAGIRCGSSLTSGTTLPLFIRDNPRCVSRGAFFLGWRF